MGGLRFEAPLTFAPILPGSVKVITDASLRVMPPDLPPEESRVMATGLTICRYPLNFGRPEPLKNEPLLRSKFMVATGQRYEYNEDKLHRYEKAGTLVQVNTTTAEDLAFLHTTLRRTDCVMRSLSNSFGRKDYILLEKVRKIASASYFYGASFVG